MVSANIVRLSVNENLSSSEYSRIVRYKKLVKEQKMEELKLIVVNGEEK